MSKKINLISSLIQTKKFKDAKIKCEEILEENMENYVFLNIFGIVLFQLKEFEDAQKNGISQLK